MESKVGSWECESWELGVGSWQLTGETIEETSVRYEGWGVAVASGVGVFVSFASLFVYTFGIFLKPLADEFGWSRETISAGFGIAAMTVAVCSPLIGFLLDRLSPRRIIVPCLTVFGCAFASLALLTPHVWHLYATCLILGIVGNGTAQMAYSRAVSSWFERRRGAALAVVLSGGAIGAMVLPPLAESLIEAIGWRGACVVLGVTVLVFGVPAVASCVRERPSEADHSRNTATGIAVRGALSTRAFWILVTVLFCSSIAQNGALTHMSALLTDRGVTAAEGALALSAMGGASLVGRLATGWMLDRFFAPRVSFCLLTLAALGTYLLSRADSLGTGIVAAVFIGFGMGGEADVTPYLISRYFGLKSFSVLYGLTWTFYAIAGAIGPVLMGEAFDVTGSYETLLTRLALVTMAVALLMPFLPRYAPLKSAAVGGLKPRRSTSGT